MTLKEKLIILSDSAKYFILCNGKYFTNPEIFNKKFIQSNLLLESRVPVINSGIQLSLFNE